MNNRWLTIAYLLVITGIPLTAPAVEWSFGIIPDTQWRKEIPFNGVAIHVVDAINAEVVRQNVDFVVAVGDLADKSSLESLQTRETHNAALREAGIEFYPLRGNHDSRTLDSVEHFSEIFPDLPGTPEGGGSSPNLPKAAGKTYAFTHRGIKFILLDSFPLVDDGTERGKAYSMAEYLPWLDEELKKDDHRAALIFSHLNLVGQKHKSNLFGKVRLTQNNRSNMQNAFFACMQKHGVKYLFCGHDHLYHRSRITSPDGKSRMQQIICGSASDKFYRPKFPFTSREVPLAQELNRVGFLIGRVDEKGIRFEYYSTDPFGEQAYAPKWELREIFGYEFNGNEFAQTPTDMKRIDRPTILSVVAKPEAIPILLALFALGLAIRNRRSIKSRLAKFQALDRFRRFKWRRLLPLLFILLSMPAIIGYRYPLDSHFWDVLLEVCCLLTGLAGLGIRALTFGYKSSASGLETTGMYSYTRHPVVLGNFLLFLSPVLFLHTLWLLVLYLLFFVVHTRLSILEQERDRQRDYGSEYTAWAACTPMLFPKSFRWLIPENGFSWKRAIRHEYRYFFGLVILLTALEHLGNFVVTDTVAVSPVWTGFLALGAGAYILVYSLIGTSLLCIVVVSLLVGSARSAKAQLATSPAGQPTINQYQSKSNGFSIYETPLTVSPYQPTFPSVQQPEPQFRFDPPTLTVPTKPSHLMSVFNIADNTRRRVFDDCRHFYTRDNALNYGVAVMGAGILANTQMDHNFQRWYHKRTQCWTTDRFSEFSKTFGEGKYFIPITVTAAFVYRYWQERTAPQSAPQLVRRPVECPVGDYFARTARGYAVGAPTLLIGQCILGGDRPRDGSSYWRPFQQNHGISGHAFIGATPFITAAHMTDNLWAKSVFYTLSILPAWSRVNDDAHYLSQAVLGWYLSYLSVRAVSETEGLKPLPRGLTLFPVVESNGAFGFGLLYRR